MGNLLRLLSGVVGATLIACSGGGGGDPVDSPGRDPSDDIEQLPTCGSLSPAEASTIVVANLEAVLRHSAELTRFADDSRVLHAALEAADGEPGLDRDELNEQIDRIIESFSTELLIDSNVEESAEATITYRIAPQVLCPDPDPEFVDQEALDDQAECLQQFTEQPLRMIVSRVDCDSGDSVRLDVLYGADRAVLGRGLLTPRSLQAEVEMAGYGALIRDSAPQDSNYVLSRAEGSAVFRLTLEGDDQATFELAVPDGLAADVTQNGDRHTTSLAASPRAASLRVDRAAKTIEGDLALAKLEFSEPFADWIRSNFDREPVGSGAFPALTTVQAAQGHFRFEAGADRVLLAGIGLGDEDATISAEGATLVRVAVGPVLDREFEAELTAAADGTLLAKVAAGFALELTYRLEPVASHVEELQSFAREDHVSIEATPGTQVRFLENELGDRAIEILNAGPVLAIEDGTLSLSSQNYPQANISVGAAQCLHQLEDVEREHEMFGDMESASCP